MGRRVSPVEAIWEEGPAAFAFLVDEWGFLGPERTDSGLAYHRRGLHIDVELWAWKNEAGFTTTVSGGADRHGREAWASLGCLYVACDLGALQAVPEGAGSHHTISKRIGQHSRALRQVMPHLDGPAAPDLLRRCQGRELPND